MSTVKACHGALGGPYFDNFFASISDSILDSIWARLELLLVPFGSPNRVKLGPKCVLSDHLFENVDFSRNALSPRRNPTLRPQDDPKTAPKTTQDRPKTAPRRSSRPSFFVFVFDIDFGPSWVPFWPWLGPSAGDQPILVSRNRP